MYRRQGAGAAQAQDWALQGYDPVTFRRQGVAVPGRAEINLMWKSRLWLFASEQNRLEFEANPRAFAPGFGGLCPVSLSEGIQQEGDPKFFAVVGERLYLTRSDAARRALIAAPRQVLTEARRVFATLPH